MRESEIEQYFVWTVQRMGGTAYKFKSPNHRGVADRIACLPDGSTWFVELKAPDGKLTALQERFGRRMKELKQNYAVLYTKEEVDEWFYSLDRTRAKP